MVTKDWLCTYLFLFTNGEDSANNFITDVTGNADRGTYSVEVASASNISIGQWVELYIKDTSTALLNEELSPYTTADLYEPANLKIVNDGVQINFDSEWVHLRKSNTEPIIRIYTESISQKNADDLAKRLIQEIKDII